jgi:hypothetical protein
LHHARAAAFAEKHLDSDRDLELGRGLFRVKRREEPGAAGTEDEDVRIEPLHPIGE